MMAASVKTRVAYADDLHAWSLEQAALLRARRTEGLDWDHLAEELEAMVGRDRRELKNRLRVILLHLLKRQAQPARRSASWRKSLRTQTGLPVGRFPVDCPYVADDVLAETYLPDRET